MTMRILPLIMWGTAMYWLSGACLSLYMYVSLLTFTFILYSVIFSNNKIDHLEVMGVYQMLLYAFILCVPFPPTPAIKNKLFQL